MSEHPPLCPKTPDAFYSRNQYVLLQPGMHVSIFPDSRRIIARYQACAWQDRADRWWKVFMHKYAKNRHTNAVHEASGKCHDIARAWREWERNQPQD